MYVYFKGLDVPFLKILWCLLCHLYSTKKFCRNDVNGKQTFGRYSIKDSQESFIYINETMQSLTEHVDFLSKRREPIQPFILGCGKTKTFNLFNVEYPF